ncbi:unnamed protein product [Cercospora beticola]|nr:unnamed protein product [Cercospora beticola]
MEPNYNITTSGLIELSLLQPCPSETSPTLPYRSCPRVAFQSPYPRLGRWTSHPVQHDEAKASARARADEWDLAVRAELLSLVNCWLETRQLCVVDQISE